jgi:hypothetical protein
MPSEKSTLSEPGRRTGCLFERFASSGGCDQDMARAFLPRKPATHYGEVEARSIRGQASAREAVGTF